MRVIPVLDVMNGVVRGIAGRRSEYRPIVSRLIADALRNGGGRLCPTGPLGACGDLDAIAGAAPAWDVYRRLLAADCSLVVDAGAGVPQRVRQLAACWHEGRELQGVVAGLESIDAPSHLPQLAEVLEPQRRIFSLDLRDGVPIASPAWQGMSPETIATLAVEAGFARLIVLDLRQVGVGRGPGAAAPLCRKLRRQLGDAVEIIAGGGVRGLDDLYALQDAGYNAALVASFSRWRPTAADLQQLTV